MRNANLYTEYDLARMVTNENPKLDDRSDEIMDTEMVRSAIPSSDWWIEVHGELEIFRSLGGNRQAYVHESYVVIDWNEGFPVCHEFDTLERAIAFLKQM